jgi:hypothetical protein
LFLATLISTAVLQSQVAPHTNTIASEEDVRKLIEVNGGIETFGGLINQYKEQLQKLRPDVPADFWNAFFATTNLNDIVAFAIPIYQKHFTHDEIKQMIAFKESPLGKKMAQEMPDIAKELAIAGQKWGERLGEKIQAQLQTTNSKVVNTGSGKTISYPTDKPTFRSPMPEEAKYLQSQGVDLSQPNTKLLFYPKEMTEPDPAAPQRTTERNVYGSWRTWKQTSEQVGYAETTITFLPGGKMNYLFTTIWYAKQYSALTGQAVSVSDEPLSQSEVFAGTWKLADGYISYDVTNFVNTAEKVVSLSAKRLTCISGINGQTYVMYRVSPQ